MTEHALMAAPEPMLTLADAGLRLMADSASPRRIPSDFNHPQRLVAPYADGLFRWPATQLRRFGEAVQVPITVTGDPGCPVGDVESRDLDPEGFAHYLKARIERGEHWHACYSSIDTKPLVDAAVAALLGAKYVKVFGWWCANPTGRPHIYPGSVATQYLWHGDYDVSTVTPHWHPAPDGKK